MKRLLSILLLAVSVVSFGQFNTGSIYATGTTGGGTGVEVDFENASYFNFNFHPEIGYFIKNRIALGAGIHTEFGLPFFDEFDEYSATYDIYIGPNIRYYLPTASNWQPYAYGNLQVGVYQKETYYFEAELGKHNFYGFQAGVGVNYFITERVAIDAKATYRFRHSWNNIGGGNHNLHRIYAEIGISLFFPSISYFDLTD